MPEKELIAPRSSMREELRRERISPEFDYKYAQTASSPVTSTGTNPMFLDPKYNPKISKTLEDGVRAYCKGKQISECSKPEKLEALFIQ